MTHSWYRKRPRLMVLSTPPWGTQGEMIRPMHGRCNIPALPITLRRTRSRVKFDTAVPQSTNTSCGTQLVLSVASSGLSSLGAWWQHSAFMMRRH